MKKACLFAVVFFIIVGFSVAVCSAGEMKAIGNQGTGTPRGQQPIQQPITIPMNTVQVHCPPLSFATSSPLPSSSVGWDYKVQLQASGGVPPIKFSTIYAGPTGAPQPSCSPANVSPGPNAGSVYYPGIMTVAGLTLSCEGIIFGQPKTVGYYQVTITATDSCSAGAQRVSKNFVIEVKGPGQN